MKGLNIAQLLADEYTIKIFELTYDRPYSAQEISLLLDIPIACAYRRVNKLEGEGLLKCVGRPVTTGGKRQKVFMSQVKNITVMFENGKLKAWKNLEEQELEEIVEPVITTGSRKR